MLQHQLIDFHGRIFFYLRLSITDVCNFRCSYCLPFGYSNNNKNFLSLFETSYMLDVFMELGIRKIRITGGEPTLRKDFFKFFNVIRSFYNIENYSFTTNGHNLFYIADYCKKIGMSSINVSLDSFNSYDFDNIVGRSGYFLDVLKGIYKCIEIGLIVKINVVIVKSLLLKDFFKYLNFIKYTDVTVRFIELMKTFSNEEFFFDNYFSNNFFCSYLLSNNWNKVVKNNISGPAVEFTHIEYKGKIGFISPYSDNFCSTCNRIRISSFGEIYLCLFGNQLNNVYSLKYFLKNRNYKKYLFIFLRDRVLMRSKLNIFNSSGLNIIDKLSTIGG